jgi:ribonuclease P protein component
MGKFRKSERLCSRKSIGKLFLSGNTLFHHPFRMLWLESGSDNPYPATIAISVPARRIKKAVNRNRIKRVIRESYRINKEILHESLAAQNRKIEMMIVFVSGTEYDFDFINKKLRELFQKFILDNATDKEIL